VKLLGLRYTREQIAAKNEQIRQEIFRTSKSVTSANFEKIDAKDLEQLFDLYDERFLNGWLRNAIASAAGSSLSFRLSSAMARAGGRTIRRSRRLRNGAITRQYEIAIATRILFMNFRHDQRPVTVCGLVCIDRLAALQRIMEHEILHLTEFLMWGRSSCNQSRFKLMAKNIFAHAASRHDLVTSVEMAAKQHSVSIGSRVQFEFDGRQLAGIVNRIHHRATVLVESKEGQPYQNGKRYLKFYIPLPMLRAENSTRG
jgi:hypothetical protein